MNKLRVGITGGIGTGKTTICAIFETLGIPIYSADERAKSIMTSNPEVKQRINSLLGEEAYFKNGRLNRAYISSVVFNNKTRLNALNKIVHPAVAKDGHAWHEAQTTAYTLKEAALLVESGSYKDVDVLILVVSPLELRIKRVVARDKCSREDVLKRIAQQLSDEEKMKYAHFIIDNDEKTPLIKQILKIHKALLKQAKKKS